MYKKLFFLLVIFISLLFISCTRKSEVEKYRTLGTDPIDDIRINEEQSEALLQWVRKGLESAVLIHVSPFDSLQSIESGTLQLLSDMIKDEKWDELQKSHSSGIMNVNYLFAAVQLGIINKMYWIIPYRLFEDIPLAKEKIKEFLRSSPSKFNTDEIQNMRMIEGCLTGLLAGVDIHICSPRTLPKIYVPVILSMDTGFFPIYASESGTSKLRALKWAMDYMTYNRKLIILHTDVSYGIESGDTSPVYRYIGDELIEILGSPQTLSAEEPPELWQLRDNAENMLSGGEDKLVKEFLAEPLTKYPEDSALRLLQAAADVRLKNYDDAYKETNENCRIDKNYCYGFIYLGNETEDTDWKKKFFQRAKETLPEIAYLKIMERQGSLVTERTESDTKRSDK